MAMEEQGIRVGNGQSPVSRFVLKRSGKPPLVFRGTLLVDLSGPTNTKDRRTRWHDLRLYRTETGRYVIEICFQTSWPRETGLYQAHLLENLTAVKESLLAYDPLQHRVGWPELPEYEKRQKTLEALIRQEYADRVGELLSRFPEDVGDVVG